MPLRRWAWLSKRMLSRHLLALTKSTRKRYSASVSDKSTHYHRAVLLTSTRHQYFQVRAYQSPRTPESSPKSNTCRSTASAATTPDCWNWRSDKCTYSPDKPAGFDFGPSCSRHDFGYYNAEKYGWFTHSLRHKVDDHFEQDMFDVCDRELDHHKREECRETAIWYYFCVKTWNTGEGLKDDR